MSTPLLRGIITDTHFSARDRMGRLAGFLARIMADGLHSAPIGIGIDEGTALLVSPDGNAEVVGAGSVYLLTPMSPPTVCASGQPLTFEGIPYRILSAGDEVMLPTASTTVPASTLSIVAGVLSPTDPY